MAPSSSPGARRSAKARAARPELPPSGTTQPAFTPPSGWRGTETRKGDRRRANGRGVAQPLRSAADVLDAEQPHAPSEQEWQDLGRPEENVPVASAVTAPAPAVAPQPQRAPIELTVCTYEDFDRMWDWARRDVEGAQRFLGQTFTHSRGLFDFLLRFMQAEHTDRTSLIRSINIHLPAQSQHVGFVVLSPILRTATPQTAFAHCYLAPDVQGQLPVLLPVLLDLATEQEPELTLMVTTTDYGFAKLLQPHGFNLSIALTRTPRATR